MEIFTDPISKRAVNNHINVSKCNLCRAAEGLPAGRLDTPSALLAYVVF